MARNSKRAKSKTKDKTKVKKTRVSGVTVKAPSEVKAASPAPSKPSKTRATKSPSVVDTVLNAKYSDITKMTKEELDALLPSLARAANKRIKVMQNSAEYAPALYMVREKLIDPETGKTYYGDVQKFSTATKKKSRNEVLSEVMQVRKFLAAKTSTAAGRRELEKESIDRLAKTAAGTSLGLVEQKKLVRAYKKMFSDKDTSRKFWEVYHKLEEDNTLSLFNRNDGSERVQRLLTRSFYTNHYGEMSEDDIITHMRELLEKEYLELEVGK